MLSNDIAALVGFACESVLYGVYIVIFVLSLAFLSWRRRTRETSWPMIISTCVLFTLCTTHFAIEFNHFYNRLGATGVPDFAAETMPLFASDIFISLIDFVGDLVLLYRCWMVWGKNGWVIILPFLTAASGFISAMVGLSLVLRIDPTAPVAPAVLVPLGTASFTLPLATNFLITILIVGRIYHIGSYSRDLHAASVITSTANHFNQAAAIVVESGMLYLITQLIFVILFAIKHPAQAIVGVAAVQVYGIAPTLISFRVGLGIAPEQTQMSTKRTAIRYRTRTTTNAQTNTSATTDVDSEYGNIDPAKTVELHMVNGNHSNSSGQLERGSIA
ncbi:hypothetical protein QCA50_013821 [Cerrena zonata]|uniref:Uncharacterized protein n=1 Tax=Cerrena zonata TaxID=2478898 RepID=A0AAW0FZQ8_9APHY